MEFPRPVFIEELQRPVYIPIRHAFQADSDIIPDPEMNHCTEHQQFLFADPCDVLIEYAPALDLSFIDVGPYKQSMGCRNDGAVKFMTAILFILDGPDKRWTDHFIFKKLYASHVFQTFVHLPSPLMLVVIITLPFNIINNSKS